MIAALVLAGAALAASYAPSTPVANESISGIASWYDWHLGEAAAGPGLRRFLGKHWRGTVVRVCSSRCITVRISDWCQCFRGTLDERLIDLDRRSFAVLADPRLGLVTVQVRG